jgi:DNA (cytosine-5)-methyltransferase 1
LTTGHVKGITKPIAVDLFAGAGGLSEGFKQAGFFVAAAVENNPYAVATYRHNHTRYKSKYRTEVLDESITEVDFAELRQRIVTTFGKSVEVVIGGPPCQGFSRANMRTRDRSNPAVDMVSHFVQAVHELKPRIAVLENVADLDRFEDGHFAASLESAFRAIDYGVKHEVLNAVDFGVPQRRRRVFYVATQEGTQFDYPKPSAEGSDPVTVWDAISDLPELSNGALVDELSYAADDALTSYQAAMRRSTNGVVRNNFVSRNGELVLKRYQHIPQGGNWENIPDELMQNYKDKSRCHHWIYLRLKQNEPSVAITHYRKSMLIHPKADRGLSVREAARIQSFPDHFVFMGPLMYQQQQVANAVPPLLAAAVAKKVRTALQC